MATRRKAKGKAQESPIHQGDLQQKDHDGQKKASEEGAGPARVIQENQS
jgi:hypothetical protein